MADHRGDGLAEGGRDRGVAQQCGVGGLQHLDQGCAQRAGQRGVALQRRQRSEQRRGQVGATEHGGGDPAEALQRAGHLGLTQECGHRRAGHRGQSGADGRIGQQAGHRVTEHRGRTRTQLRGQHLPELRAEERGQRVGVGSGRPRWRGDAGEHIDGRGGAAAEGLLHRRSGQQRDEPAERLRSGLAAQELGGVDGALQQPVDQVEVARPGRAARQRTEEGAQRGGAAGVGQHGLQQGGRGVARERAHVGRQAEGGNGLGGLLCERAQEGCVTGQLADRAGRRSDCGRGGGLGLAPAHREHRPTQRRTGRGTRGSAAQQGQQGSADSGHRTRCGRHGQLRCLGGCGRDGSRRCVHRDGDRGGLGDVDRRGRGRRSDGSGHRGARRAGTTLHAAALGRCRGAARRRGVGSRGGRGVRLLGGRRIVVGGTGKAGAGSGPAARCLRRRGGLRLSRVGGRLRRGGRARVRTSTGVRGGHRRQRGDRPADAEGHGQRPDPAHIPCRAVPPGLAVFAAQHLNRHNAPPLARHRCCE